MSKFKSLLELNREAALMLNHVPKDEYYGLMNKEYISKEDLIEYLDSLNNNPKEKQLHRLVVNGIISDLERD